MSDQTKKILRRSELGLAQLLGVHRTLKLAKDVRPGRNAKCSCGSGKKFKACCGLKSSQSSEFRVQDGCVL